MWQTSFLSYSSQFICSKHNISMSTASAISPVNLHTIRTLSMTFDPDSHIKLSISFPQPWKNITIWLPISLTCCFNLHVISCSTGDCRCILMYIFDHTEQWELKVCIFVANFSKLLWMSSLLESFPAEEEKVRFLSVNLFFLFLLKFQKSIWMDILIIPDLILKFFVFLCPFYMSYFPCDWQDVTQSTKSNRKDNKF